MSAASNPGTEGRLQSLARREVPVRAMIGWSRQHAAALLIGFAILADVAEYAHNRGFWLDEGSLAGALSQIAQRGFLAPLANCQLAPPGFLVVESVTLRAFGPSPLALRLFPLASAIVAVLLFYQVARRCLAPRGVLIALALYACSDELIYFSSEFKQYMTDVAAGLACTLMGLIAAQGTVTVRRALGLAAVGASVVWFSHPSAFVLGGIGGSLIVAAVARRRWRSAALLSLAASAWLASFAVLYRVSMNHLGTGRGMWAFWDFAFPPTFWTLSWPAQRFAYLFVNPLDFTTPLGTTVSAIVPFLLFLVGCASLARRAPLCLALLIAPLFVVMGATFAHRYPFHGRLLLFLVPSLLLLIAEGADRIGGAARRRWVWVVLLTALLLFPSLSAVFHLATGRDNREFNTHGDRRPQWLDPARFPL